PTPQLKPRIMNDGGTTRIEGGPPHFAQTERCSRMRIAELSSSAARLRDAADMLVADWNATQESWNDANSRSLEETRLRPLVKDVQTALSAIQHLSEVMSQAQRSCES